MAQEISKTMTFGEKLYAEKEYVDVKILCNGKTFKCHKNVLSCQSEVSGIMYKYSCNKKLPNLATKRK